MRTTFERASLSPSPRGSVVSIGVFDGVHLGHQAILAANVWRARELSAEATVITFRRHPKKLLLGLAPRTLTTLEHRLELFLRADIGHVVVLSFDEELRNLAAPEFVRTIALERLAARAFVLGVDSKFGRERAGTAELLRALGHDVTIVPQVVIGGRPVSSTVIREAVELGDLARASEMLGRAVSVLGRVVRGEDLGHRIGFPTANLDLHHELHPPPGVYAVRGRMVTEAAAFARTLEGVANIGYRPTVARERPDHPRVEVHFFDFAGDLYGQRIELAFVARLRGERRFPDLEELRAQIARDVVLGKDILAGRTAPPRSTQD